MIGDKFTPVRHLPGGVRHGGAFHVRQSLASVSAPVFLPFCGPATGYHVTRHIAGLRRDAEGRGAAAARAAIRTADHRWAANKDMAFAGSSRRLSNQLNERIARFERIGIGTWMTDTTASVHFSGCNTG